jgi:hypothetical protein
VDTLVIIAIITILLTAGVGLVSTLLRLRLDFTAQSDLVRLMRSHISSLQHLQEERSALVKAPPDPAKLEDATEVVQTVADGLPKRQKRAVLAHLNQSPQASKASYLVKVIDQAAEHPTSAPETGAST